MTHYNRADWRAKEPTGRYDLDRLQVHGIALHWPAITKPLTNPQHVMSALRAWQQYHMVDRGWSDIAYQVAIDQLGNTYSLRGLRRRSAANGDEDVNREYGALLLVVAQGETPTRALIDATKGRIARHQQLFHLSKLIVGHREIRPEELGSTACPGDRIQQLIDDGKFRPNKVDR